MKKWALHFLIFMMPVMFAWTSPAFENRLPGARSAALAHASVALSGSEALFHNPALLIPDEKLLFTFSYESRFLLKELSLMAAGVAFSPAGGTFGATLIQFGTGIYRENKLGLIYAKKLSHHISASVGFDYLAERLPENSKPFSALTVETGLAVHYNEKMTIGINAFNPVMTKLELPGGKVSIPWEIRAGNSWNVTNWLLFCSELNFIGGYKTQIHTGLEFNPCREVSVRLGVSGSPLQISTGAGFKVGRIVFDIAFTQNGNLGFTPVAGIVFIP
jgi:hypothetical protein